MALALCWTGLIYTSQCGSSSINCFVLGKILNHASLKSVRGSHMQPHENVWWIKHRKSVSSLWVTCSEHYQAVEGMRCRKASLDYRAPFTLESPVLPGHSLCRLLLPHHCCCSGTAQRHIQFRWRCRRRSFVRTDETVSGRERLPDCFTQLNNSVYLW